MNLHPEGRYEEIMAGRWKLKPTFICNRPKSRWAPLPSHSHLSFFLWAETLGVSRGTDGGVSEGQRRSHSHLCL